MIDPTKRRETALQRDLSRLQKSIERLLTAYQEDLLSIDELRHRMPDLRRREHAIRAELQSIVDQTTDRAVYLRVAETLFLPRLRSSAKTLDIIERQRVVRLLVKEILIDAIPGRPDHPKVLAGHRVAAPPALCRAQVIFCVQGATTPPCGVPFSLPTRLPSAI